MKTYCYVILGIWLYLAISVFVSPLLSALKRRLTRPHTVADCVWRSAIKRNERDQVRGYIGRILK